MSLQEIAEHIDQMTVSLDDTFRFRCSQCGKCCIHREDILLSPYDLYKIAGELQLNPIEVCKRYCEPYIGSNSRLPIVRLMPQGAVQRCPFLKNQKCSIHKAKPAVCAMFPLGRYIKVDADNYSKEGMANCQTQYLLQPIECGDSSETHTVRSWLSDFDISSEDETFIRWHQMIAQVGNILKKAEKMVGEETMCMVWDTVFALLYLNYTTDKPFMPQFEQNASHTLELLSIFEQPEGEKQHA